MSGLEIHHRGSLFLCLILVIARVVSKDLELSREEHDKICRKTLLDFHSTMWYTDMMTDPKPECSIRKPSESDQGDEDKKLLIVTPHTNAYLIKVQKQSLDLFVKEPFEYIVYDDSMPFSHFTNWKTEGMSTKIKHTTEDNGGIYRNVSQAFHSDRRCLFPETLEPYLNNPNTRCSDIYQYILRDRQIYCHEGVVLFLDADVILTKPFNPSLFMKENDLHIVSVPQLRNYSYSSLNTGEIKTSQITYMWTALNIMNIPTLRTQLGLYDMNWDCGYINSFHEIEFSKTLHLDSGGHTYEWIDRYKPNITWFTCDNIYELGDSNTGVNNGNGRSKNRTYASPTWAWFSNEWQQIYKKNQLYDLEFKSQLLGGLFLHLRNAGNWMSHGKRYKWIQPEQIKVLMTLLNKRYNEFVETA